VQRSFNARQRFRRSPDLPALPQDCGSVNQMAELIAPSQLAKELGIRMQSIYGLVSRGKVTGHRPEGSKSVMVDPDEVRKVLGDTASKGGSRRGVVRGPRKPKNDVAAVTTDGTIIAARPSKKSGRVALRQTTGRVLPQEADDPSYNGLVKMQKDSGKVDLYDANFWSQAIAEGSAVIASAEYVLSMVVYQLVCDERDEDAASLERWMTKRGFEVKLPGVDD